jgi:uncharacterized protein (DUF2249 family)
VSATIEPRPDDVTALPAPVAAADVRGAVRLDVRPILDKGGDPFRHIMKTLESLADDVALHLVVGFEPTPLYAVMKSRGRVAFTEKLVDAFHVWFYREPGQVTLPQREAERAPLAPPVELDVRGLEPPRPLVAILERLAELGPGAQLLVRHHREPVLLYDKLKLRGYAAVTTRRGEGDYLVHIAPEWAIEGASRG